MGDAGLVVVRRQLGKQLKRLREEAGKTIKSVSDAKLFSESKVARIEAGKMPVAVPDIWVLCRFYGVSSEATDALSALAEGTSNDRWWDESPGVVPEWFDLYVGLESVSTALNAYHSELIHGLLQTDDYARAVVATDGAEDDRVIEGRLKLRSDRQDAALQNPSMKIGCVLGHGAISLEVGSLEVMSSQVAHLAELSQRPNIDVRVLPRSAGAHAGLAGPFTVMGFPSPEDPTVVYLESRIGAQYVEKVHQVAVYQEAFRSLYAQATPIEEYTP